MADRPVGPGTTLALGYMFFTLAAGARAIVQISTKFHVAPFAYVMSGVAAVIYATGAVLLIAADHGRLRTAARRLCQIEIAGVVIIGTLSLLAPSLFADQSVWSGFGAGYAWVPAVLPLVALFWLHRSGERGGDDGTDGRIGEREAVIDQPLGDDLQRAEQVVGE